jgi:glycosyltransferase involved in cell wall biosynthesis
MTRIALISGICVANDAISSAVVSQARSLLSMPEVESVHIFSQHFDRELDIPTHPVHNSWQLLRHPDFALSDVAIFHWGIHYDLFDATIVAAAEARDGHGPIPVVHFHNCTPRELVDPESYHTIDRSTQQLQLVASLELNCWTFSPFNELTLTELGVDPSRIRFVPFPITAPGELQPNRRHDAVDIAVVGRIVRAKGHHVLLDALAQLPKEMGNKLQVRIAGNIPFSSASYLAELEEQVDRLGLGRIVHFIGQPDTDALWALYCQSHLLVTASLHEGLCVPVIEAYIAGCRVVGVSAGNLPFVVQPPDRLVTPNDPAALAEGISQTVAEILDGTLVDRRTVADLLNQFTERSTIEHLRAGLSSLRADTPQLQGT